MASMMRKGSPAIAVALSLLVFPGTGQMYNRQWAKGGLFATGFGVTLALWLHSLWPLVTMFSNLMANPTNAALDSTQPVLMGMVPWMIACLVVYTAAAIDSFVCAARRAAAPVDTP